MAVTVSAARSAGSGGGARIGGARGGSAREREELGVELALEQEESERDEGELVEDRDRLRERSSLFTARRSDPDRRTRERERARVPLRRDRLHCPSPLPSRHCSAVHPILPLRIWEKAGLAGSANECAVVSRAGSSPRHPAGRAHAALLLVLPSAVSQGERASCLVAKAVELARKR